MALTDSEYADIAYFLGYPSYQNMANIKTRIISSFGQTPTLATYRENTIRDLIRQLKQYQKDIRAGEQNFGMVRQPGVVINSAERQAMLISSARNCVADLEQATDVGCIGDVFNRGRGNGSVRLSR
jgi:hypothetical protein